MIYSIIAFICTTNSDLADLCFLEKHLRAQISEFMFVKSNNTLTNLFINCFNLLLWALQYICCQTVTVTDISAVHYSFTFAYTMKLGKCSFSNLTPKGTKRQEAITWTQIAHMREHVRSQISQNQIFTTASSSQVCSLVCTTMEDYCGVGVRGGGVQRKREQSER